MSALPAIPGPENRNIVTNLPEGANDTNSGVSGQVDASFASGTLSSITAFRKWKNTQFQDGDSQNTVYVGVNQSHDRGDLDSKQSSQEFRWASNKGGFIDYVAGFFYFNNKTTMNFPNNEHRIENARKALLGVSIGDAFGDSFFGETDKILENIFCRDAIYRVFFFE